MSEILSMLNHIKKSSNQFQKNYEFSVDRAVTTMLARHFGPRKIVYEHAKRSRKI